MQTKKIIISALICMGSVGMMHAQKWKEDPVSKAVMESYDKMLADNPKDYQVYFRRASDYYNHNAYSEALADINKALVYAPEKEKDARFSCYSLQASVYERMDMKAKAVESLEKALALNPSSYTILYQKANIEYQLTDYKAAREDYTRLQRLNSRSQEALFGLARCAAAEGEKVEAMKYANDAVELTPQSAESYIHRAEIRELLGDNRDAADDYLVAVKLAKDSELSKPLQGMVNLSFKDYDAVNKTLTSAINKSPRNGKLYYMRAAIAKDHFRFGEALSDFSYINTHGLLDTPSLYRSLAECCYALCDFDQAADFANDAIGSSANNAKAYTLKSEIKNALEQWRLAETAADHALAKSEDDAEALVAKSIALLGQGKSVEASTCMGKAALAAPSDAWIKMLRAWVLCDYVNQPSAAAEYYKDIVEKAGSDSTSVSTFKGFALLYLDRRAEADAWMKSVLDAAKDGADGEAAYYGACYYAAAGDKERAFDCMKDALKKGFADLRLWRKADVGRVSVASLRTDPRFDALLSAYSSIFQSK